MKIGLSSSSPIAVAALLDNDFRLVEELCARAERNASGLLIDMVERLLKPRELDLGDLSGIVVDRGPGGFTGVKVAVTLAKAMAWGKRVPLYASTSFDLINPDATVSVPYKRGKFIVREPNGISSISDAFAGVGYGEGEADIYPTFANARHAEAVEPHWLVPLYIAEPSISEPRSGRPGHGKGS